MGWFLLIAGLALWYAAHLFKRLLPAQRAALGDPGKGLVALSLIAAVILMTLGYKGADGAFFWGRSPALVGINNLLMLLAVYLYAASGMRTRITRRLRHPQLTGFKIWAVAHILVNGDLPSLVLFGALLIWAVIEVIVINRAVPDWTRPEPAPARTEISAILATIVVTGAVMLVHDWLGVQPWG